MGCGRTGTPAPRRELASPRKHESLGAVESRGVEIQTDALPSGDGEAADRAISLRMTSVYALVVAAGRGSRFGGALPKQYLSLDGVSLLRHAVAAFVEHPRVADVLVAIHPEDRDPFDRAVAGLGVMAPVAGGPTRQDSVRLGLEALASCRPERVLIHDGARPFPDPELIDRVIDALDEAPATIP